MFILLQEDPPSRRYGTKIGMVCDDRRQLGKQKGIDAFSSIFGFASEAEKSCPPSEIFKRKDCI